MVEKTQKYGAMIERERQALAAATHESQSQQAQHSRTPWERDGVVVRDPHGLVAASAHGLTVPEALANAALIVRCVNSHAALIDALQTIEAIMCDKPLCGHFTAEEIREVVHSAIAKAEGR